jgi:hypothetical protein
MQIKEVWEFFEKIVLTFLPLLGNNGCALAKSFVLREYGWYNILPPAWNKQPKFWRGHSRAADALLWDVKFEFLL